MQVSEFKRKKLNFVFDTFFDVNKDGCIQEDDFDLAIRNISKIKGYKVGTPKYKEISSAFLKIWDGLRNHADVDGDDKISREEWVNLWSTSEESWKADYMNFMFKLFDSDDDGFINASEFKTVTYAYGVLGKDAENAFDKMSQSRKLIVDIKYFATLWAQFFSSDEPSDVGNCIFGQINFD